MYLVKVYITGKESVLDPQGTAVKGALHSLNYTQVIDVRVGKYIELIIDVLDSEMFLESYIESMCEKLLANTVVESYSYEIEEVVSS